MPEHLPGSGAPDRVAELITPGGEGGNHLITEAEAAVSFADGRVGQAVSEGTASVSKASGGFFAPLRVANFRRLITGQAASRLGDQFYFVALPWLVLRISDTAHAAASLALVSGVSAAMLGLFTLTGGVLADRYGPRALMLGSDVARLITVSVLAALALLSTPPLWVLILLAALLGIAGGLFYPASMAMVPLLVPGEDLQAGNSFEQLTLQVSNFVGPGVAGVVLGATRLALGFVIDAVSFVVSVVSLMLIRLPRRARDAQAATKPAEQKRGGGLRDLGEAFRFIRSSRFLFTLLGLSLLANFAANGLFEVALPLLLKQWVGLDGGPRALGLVVGGFGLGSVIGAVTAGAATKLRHKTIIAIMTLLPVAALIAGGPLLGGVLPLAGTYVAMGMLIALSNVLFITLIQQAIPMEMMGRVMSFVMLGSFVGTPLSIAAYGAAASVVPNVVWLFVAGGALFAVPGLLALTQKLFWQAE